MTRRAKTAQEVLDFLLANARRDENGCLICHLAPNAKGYSPIAVGEKKWRAHRFVYHMLKGPVTPELLVCHTCDVRRCIEIKHLYAGTAQQNTDDMMRKGRHVVGAKSKVTEEMLTDFLDLHDLGMSNVQIGKLYGLSHECIRENIRRALSVS